MLYSWLGAGVFFRNSRILSRNSGLGILFKEFRLRILEFLGNSRIRGSCCKKLGSKIFLLRIRWLLRNRLVALFSFKAAALAVGGGRQQLQKFCAEFSRRKPQKKSAKVFAKWLGYARL